MTKPNNTFDENLELSKSLVTSVWERLENLGMAKGGPGSGPHKGGGDLGARRDTVQGAPKGGGARVDKVKDGSGRTTYAVSCPSCGLRQMSGLTHEGGKAMADAHNAASHSNSRQG